MTMKELQEAMARIEQKLDAFIERNKK